MVSRRGKNYNNNKNKVPENIRKTRNNPLEIRKSGRTPKKKLTVEEEEVLLEKRKQLYKKKKLVEMGLKLAKKRKLLRMQNSKNTKKSKQKVGKYTQERTKAAEATKSQKKVPEKILSKPQIEESKTRPPKYFEDKSAVQIRNDSDAKHSKTFATTQRVSENIEPKIGKRKIKITKRFEDYKAQIEKDSDHKILDSKAPGSPSPILMITAEKTNRLESELVKPKINIIKVDDEVSFYIDEAKLMSAATSVTPVTPQVRVRKKIVADPFRQADIKRSLMEEILQDHYTPSAKSKHAPTSPPNVSTKSIQNGSPVKNKQVILPKKSLNSKHASQSPLAKIAPKPSFLSPSATQFVKIAPKGKVNMSVVSSNRSKPTKPSYYPCHICDYVSSSRPGYQEHVEKRHPAAVHPLQQYRLNQFFHFPNFLGFNCQLLGSNFQSVFYYVTEVRQPVAADQRYSPEHLADTCYFFIPETVLAQFIELKNHTNIHIPYSSHKHGFAAYFPNSRSALQVRWATSLATAEACVEERTMFILTKSRFKLIQSVRGGKDKRGSGSYGAFCKFLDEDQANLENFIRAQTEPLLQSCAPTAQETSVSQVTVEQYRCPWQDCDFVSDRRYSGIRNHLIKHFKDKIEKEAKPRAMLSEREKSNCMSKTGCSVPVLVARGELIHHFGIFHCLVDDLFQDFGFSWVQEKYTSHFIKCLCPYEDKTYEDETAFLEHLTLDHFFNLILTEVEDMVKFSLTYLDEHNCMANVYKCPFCKKKFTNPADGRNIRDVREMVVHCGAEHGFALYYLMSDNNVERTRQSLATLRVKTEPIDEEELLVSNAEIVNIENIPKIKLEPMDETETEINNFLEVEMNNLVNLVKEETFDSDAS